MQVLKDISPDSIIFAEADNNTVRFITSERAYKMRMKMTEAMVTLCTVLSELLDNAIEAAGQTGTERIGTEKSVQCCQGECQEYPERRTLPYFYSRVLNH